MNNVENMGNHDGSNNDSISNSNANINCTENGENDNISNDFSIKHNNITMIV